MKTILLCRSQQVPTAEQVAESLCQKGYSAIVEARAEIRYAPGRMPIVVSFYNDLIDDPDVGDSDYWEWMEELVPDIQAREGIRRFLFVSAMENVDVGAFQAVVSYLRDRTNAIVITQEQSEAQQT